MKKTKIIKTNKGEDKYLLGLERYGNMWRQDTKYKSIEEVIEAAKKWPIDDVSNPVCIVKESIEIIKKFKHNKSLITWGGYSYAILDEDKLEVINIGDE